MVICFAYQDTIGAALEVTDNKEDQVVVRFIPYKDEHITIHKHNHGNLTKTHRAQDKPPSVWDSLRVDAARALGYKYPERHGQYVVHSPFVQGDLFEFGEHIVSRRFDVSRLSTKAKYFKDFVEVKIDNERSMLGFYFHPKKRISTEEVLIAYETSLGWLHIVEEVK